MVFGSWQEAARLPARERFVSFAFRFLFVLHFLILFAATFFCCKVTLKRQFLQKKAVNKSKQTAILLVFTPKKEEILEKSLKFVS